MDVKILYNFMATSIATASEIHIWADPILETGRLQKRKSPKLTGHH